MKTLISTAALALAIALTLTIASCGKGGGDLKLLESITDDGGKVLKKFEYDDKNRIVKIIEGNTTKTITYNSDDLVTVSDNNGSTQKYVKKGNIITVEDKDGSRTITLDKDGGINFQAEDGYVEEDGYSYDDKKSPLFNCATQKWLLLEMSLHDYATKNNLISHTYPGVEETFEYEYDSDGFPTKRKETADAGGSEKTTEIIHYTYRGGKTEATAADKPAASSKQTPEEAAAIEYKKLLAEKAQADAEAAAAAEAAAKEAVAKAEAAKAVASCGKGGGDGVKLPECIIINNDYGDCNATYKFEYDDKNRIVKHVFICFFSSPNGEIDIANTNTTTITYNTDDLITMESVGYGGSNDGSKSVKKFVRKGNTITSESDTLTINKDGYIEKRNGYGTYKYENGNLAKEGDRAIYTYDNNKSPFSNINAPKWLLIILEGDANKNNVLSNGDDDYKHSYEYDSEGFPIEKTVDFVGECQDVCPPTVIRYTYRGKGGAK